ncbi:hypothetical protein [uncultured Dokdonia sp.]|uniref:hypothetical protein n=1 Tax=uncultured Dokdonia sp. TaxID=575653 RepID=UPI00262D45CF|nr:hypothetical protein [uncultured Dokdonia sp.]
MLLGYFDYLVIAILIFLNYTFWNEKLEGKTGCILGSLLFGCILPMISQIIEIKYVEMTIGIQDDFEALYTFLRFPTYWILGIIQVILISIKNK